MKRSPRILATALVIAAAAWTAAAAPATAPGAGKPGAPYAPKQSDRPQPITGDEPGFASIFDGRTLDGWKGDPTYWRVDDGALVTGRKLDFQGDRVREGFKGRVPAGNGVGPL